MDIFYSLDNLSKLDINIIRCALLHEYKKEKELKEICLRNNDHINADLRDDMITRILLTLGKVDNIVMLADDLRGKLNNE